MLNFCAAYNKDRYNKGHEDPRRDTKTRRPRRTRVPTSPPNSVITVNKNMRDVCVHPYICAYICKGVSPKLCLFLIRNGWNDVFMQFTFGNCILLVCSLPAVFQWIPIVFSLNHFCANKLDKAAMQKSTRCNHLFEVFGGTMLTPYHASLTPPPFIYHASVEPELTSCWCLRG